MSLRCCSRTKSGPCDREIVYILEDYDVGGASRFFCFDHLLDYIKEQAQKRYPQKWAWTPSENDSDCLLCGHNIPYVWTRSDGMWIRLKMFFDHTIYWNVYDKDGRREISDQAGMAKQVMKLVDERYPLAVT